MGENNVFLQFYWDGIVTPSTGVNALLTTHCYRGGRTQLLQIPANKMDIWYVHGQFTKLCSPGLYSVVFEQVPHEGQRFLQPLQRQEDYDDLALLGSRVAGIRVYAVKDTPELALAQ